MTRPHALTDEELDAIRRLQEGRLAPSVHDPVWRVLLSLSLVWRDDGVRPPTIRLTPFGRGYPTDD